MSQSISRRTALGTMATAAAGASMAALPALAVASEPDPIFAAIEAHRAAHATFVAVFGEEDRLEAELPADRRRSSNSGGELTIVPSDAPEWILHEQAARATSDAEEDAAIALTCVVPTTLAGVQAVLRYAAEHIAHDHVWPDAGNIADDDGRSRLTRDWNFFLHRMLAEALGEIVA